MSSGNDNSSAAEHEKIEEVRRLQRQRYEEYQKQQTRQQQQQQQSAPQYSPLPAPIAQPVHPNLNHNGYSYPANSSSIYPTLNSSSSSNTDAYHHGLSDSSSNNINSFQPASNNNSASSIHPASTAATLNPTPNRSPPEYVDIDTIDNVVANTPNTHFVNGSRVSGLRRPSSHNSASNTTVNHAASNAAGPRSPSELTADDLYAIRLQEEFNSMPLHQRSAQQQATNISPNSLRTLQDAELARKLAAELYAEDLRSEVAPQRSRTGPQSSSGHAQQRNSGQYYPQSSPATPHSNSATEEDELLARRLQAEEAQAVAEANRRLREQQQSQQDFINSQIMGQLSFLAPELSQRRVIMRGTGLAGVGELGYQARTQPPNLAQALVDHSIAQTQMRRYNGRNIDIDRMNYDQLLALGDEIGTVKPKGLKKQEISRLPTSKYSKDHNKSARTAQKTDKNYNGMIDLSEEKATENAADAESCSICLMDFEEGEKIKRLPCFHAFHAQELDKWLREASMCPICRAKVEIP
jgi:hypothetical protein